MKNRLNLKLVFNLIVTFILGALSIIFGILYANTFDSGFFYDYKIVFNVFITIFVCFLIILSLIFLFKNKDFVYKLTIIIFSLLVFAFAVLYLLKNFGVLDKIDSIEDLRNYVASFGGSAVAIYIIMNVLQVVILPIPGFIAVGTGVALFGALKASIYSFIGIIIGSFIAFFIGRFLGYKVVKWLVGEETLNKWLNAIKNKDKIILTFMFLFPLFPDDVLCFVAGLSSMSVSFFVTMIIICRIISIFATAYSLNGSIIPYTEWWGIVIWGVIFAITIIATILIYKNGDKLQKYFKKLRKKEDRKGDENDFTR